MRRGIARGARDLRCAAKRVGILDQGAVRSTVARDDRRAGEDPFHVRGRDGLAGLGPQCLQMRREHLVGAEQAFDAHRRGDIGQHQQTVEVGQRQDQLPEHAVGAVDEGEALLLGEDDRFQAVRGKRFRCGHQLAVHGSDVSLAHDGQRHMRKRREISGTAEAAVLVDNRRESSRQQFRIGLGDLGADAGPAGGQGRQPQQHHRADHLAFHLGTRSGGMRANQAALQLRPQLRRYVSSRKGAESGGNAVCRSRVVGERFDPATARGHGSEGVLARSQRMRLPARRARRRRP